jgi:pimeloyl-ACP methyl ester carboxylesterase
LGASRKGTPKQVNVLEREFSVQFGTHRLKGDVLSLSETDPARLVILHGAGLGTRDRFRYFRTCLAQHAISSLAFDFVGHGETGGDLSESSLQSRTEQACAVIDAVGVTRPFSLLGSSMGAYNAVKLLEVYPVENIILFVPGMYHAAAYSVPFGEEFSQIIRKPNSWVDSDAWSILETFRGRLLLIVAGQDDVIPEDVIRRIYASATSVSARAIYVVPHSPHLLIHHLSQERHEFEYVIGLVRNHLDGKSA